MNDMMECIEAESRSNFDLSKSIRVVHKPQPHAFFFDNDLLEKTFEYMDFKSLKAFRFVCKQWNRMITKRSLWQDGYFVIEARGSSLKNIFDLSVVAKCPNFIWRRVDLRYAPIHLFFVNQGLKMKRLKFVECVFSISTLQYLLICCPHLKALEICAFPQSIFTTEGLFGTEERESVLIDLRDLSLVSGRIESDGELDPVLFCYLIGTSMKLKRVSLCGWSKGNCKELLNALQNNANWRDLETLELIDMGPKNNDSVSDALKLLADDQFIKLKKLAIVPTNKLYYDSSIDSVICSILEKQRNIVHLDVRNLPITNDAFTCELPQLKRLQIRNSSCDQMSYLAFMPKLEEIDLEDFYAPIHRLIHRAIPDRILDLFGRKMHRLLVHDPQHFIADSSRTNVKVWLVKFLIDVFAILFVLGLVPASVFFLLKIVCPDAENEDFVMSTIFIFAIIYVVWKWVC